MLENQLNDNETSGSVNDINEYGEAQANGSNGIQNA